MTAKRRRMGHDEKRAIDGLARAYFEDLVSRMEKSPAVEEFVDRMKP